MGKCGKLWGGGVKGGTRILHASSCWGGLAGLSAAPPPVGPPLLLRARPFLRQRSGILFLPLFCVHQPSIFIRTACGGDGGHDAQNLILS